MLDLDLALALGDANGTGQQHSPTSGYAFAVGSYAFAVGGALLGVAVQADG